MKKRKEKRNTLRKQKQNKKERKKEINTLKNKFVFHFRYNWNSYGIAFESTVYVLSKQ